METFLSIVAIGGSIASIFSAVWAFMEAKKAARSASAAERIRQELVDHRELTEVAKIHSEIKRVLSSVARVGPTSTELYVKGLNCTDIATEVQTFVSMLLEQSSHFSDIYSNRVSELRNVLKRDIEGLAAAQAFEDKKRFGMNIYYSLENFTPVVKQLLDAKQEHSLRT